MKELSTHIELDQARLSTGLAQNNEPLIYQTFDELRAVTPEWFTILCSQFGSLSVSQWLEPKEMPRQK